MRSLSGNSRSLWLLGMLTSKVISLMRFQMALSVPLISGLWFVAMNNVCVGQKLVIPAVPCFLAPV